MDLSVPAKTECMARGDIGTASEADMPGLLLGMGMDLDEGSFEGFSAEQDGSWPRSAW